MELNNKSRTATGTSSNQRLIYSFLGITWIVVAAWSLYSGLDYYRLPLFEKAYSELHDLYRPSGLIGHGFGIIGSLFMIVGVTMYSLRKRYVRLHNIGKLRTWLTFHIFLCTLGPYLVVLHTAFRFGGLISISFWSMILVVGSGIFGRFVYTRIPKTVDGEFVSENLLFARRNRLIISIESEFDIPKETVSAIVATGQRESSVGLFSAISSAVRFDYESRRLPAIYEKALRREGLGMIIIDDIVQRMMDARRIHQQMTVLLPFQRLFGYWHVFHLPLASIMFVIMVLHIGVAVTFGYTWIG